MREDIGMVVSFWNIMQCGSECIACSNEFKHNIEKRKEKIIWQNDCKKYLSCFWKIIYCFKLLIFLLLHNRKTLFFIWRFINVVTFTTVSCPRYLFKFLGSGTIWNEFYGKYIKSFYFYNGSMIFYWCTAIFQIVIRGLIEDTRDLVT